MEICWQSGIKWKFCLFHWGRHIQVQHVTGFGTSKDFYWFIKPSFNIYGRDTYICVPQPCVGHVLLNKTPVFACFLWDGIPTPDLSMLPRYRTTSSWSSSSSTTFFGISFSFVVAASSDQSRHPNTANCRRDNKASIRVNLSFLFLAVLK